MGKGYPRGKLEREENNASKADMLSWRPLRPGEAGAERARLLFILDDRSPTCSPY
jgi:hypothetical protein